MPALRRFRPDRTARSSLRRRASSLQLPDGGMPLLPGDRRERPLVAGMGGRAGQASRRAKARDGRHLSRQPESYCAVLACRVDGLLCTDIGARNCRESVPARFCRFAQAQPRRQEVAQTRVPARCARRRCRAWSCPGFWLDADDVSEHVEVLRLLQHSPRYRGSGCSRESRAGEACGSSAARSG